MIKRFCDICDKEIKREYNDNLTLSLVICDEELGWGRKQLKYDLCPSCREKIENFISVLKKNG